MAIGYGLAAMALGEIGAEPEATVPALIRSLTNSDIGVRLAATRAIACFGTEAAAAIPVLRAAKEDQNQRVRRLAARALVRVQCENYEGRLFVALLSTGE